ncbi:MAG: TatD family hydrolase [Clostridia bacterium]|nr:TatD family hydrolase [Clostridia bacterium]
MRIFDTHCHLASDAYSEDLDQVIARFFECGGRHANIIADPCEDEPNQEAVVALAQKHPFFVFSIGVHPHNAENYCDAAEKVLLEYVKHPKCRLLGEIGLDFHYDLSPRDIQKSVFDRQLGLAYDLGMKVQLHIREAHPECMDIFRSRLSAGNMPQGILHCFSGDWEMAKFYLDAGFDISLAGSVTFKKAPEAVDVAKNIPLDRLLIETDCPYLAPVPLRGRRNEPAYLTHSIAKIAEIRGISPETLADTLYANSLRALNVSETEEN